MKLGNTRRKQEVCWSHPARGAWIEMYVLPARGKALACRTPQGVRGLKCKAMSTPFSDKRRTPQGVRGLKLTCSPKI